MLFSDSKHSPLAANYRIYSKPVLDAMKNCSPPRTTTLDAFGDCIETVAKKQTNSKVEAELWLKPPKPLELVSGVRDRPFFLDAKLAFLQSGGKMGDPPLQFLIQDTDAKGDPNVWSFETLVPTIEEGIDDLVRTNTVAGSILTDAEDFTILQRLFWVIFDGQLRGDRLLRQVADLVDQLRPKIHDEVATSQWNAAGDLPGVAEARALADLHGKLSVAPSPNKPVKPEVTAALRTLAACARAVAKFHERISAAAWQANCSFSNVREPLTAACHAGSDSDETLVCQLAYAAAFSEKTFAMIKLAELLTFDKQSNIRRATRLASRKLRREFCDAACV
jgi:hypothetical protein